LGKTYIMNEFKSGLNPLSSENLPILIYSLIVVGVMFVLTMLIEKYIIPRLNPENRFVMWWKKHIIDEDPFHL
jgi:hypothetical protein